MTRYSVQRFRAAVLHMYLRIAVIVAFPLFLLHFLFIATPDRGVALLAFALYALWLKWRTRRDSEESLRHANWFVLAIMCLMLYGAYVSNERMHLEVWMMIFPIVYTPIVASRERMVWALVGAVSIASVVLLRPEPLSSISAFVFVAAYLILGFITLMLVRHNEQNIERLAHLSIIDPLTKAYNRGYLKDVMVSEINRCRRSGNALTVIMLDIDYFKMFNDKYGHLFGDSVLEQVAEVLKRTAQRAGDYVFRYGGEEFCIVTSGLSRAEARLFAEKLRLSICALDIENRHSPHQHLTASAGYWCVSDLSEITPSALLLNADNALYRAKDAGRNAVVDFDDISATGTEPVMAEKAPA
ncbi:MAG: GGDEF domain-containing protein [Nitrosomonadales bacterium]|nr:GGDEF domain-containing protein [Nitrosomonadales bacterium]